VREARALQGGLPHRVERVASVVFGEPRRHIPSCFAPALAVGVAYQTSVGLVPIDGEESEQDGEADWGAEALSSAERCGRRSSSGGSVARVGRRDAAGRLRARRAKPSRALGLAGYPPSPRPLAGAEGRVRNLVPPAARGGLREERPRRRGRAG